MAMAMLQRQPMGSPLSLGRRILEKYVAIPFLDGGRDFSGVDCWGLIYLMYKHELSIELPTYGAISASELLAVQRQIESDKTHDTWMCCGDRAEQCYDIVVMTGTMRSNGGSLRSALVHVGIVTGPRFMLHTEDGIGMQHVPFKGAGVARATKARVKEVYRHVAFSLT